VNGLINDELAHGVDSLLKSAELTHTGNKGLSMIRCMQSYVTWRLAVPVPGDLARARNVLGNRARLDRLSISGQGWTGLMYSSVS